MTTLVSDSELKSKITTQTSASTVITETLNVYRDQVTIDYA